MRKFAKKKYIIYCFSSEYKNTKEIRVQEYNKANDEN